MPRTMLNDEHWMKLKEILLQIGIYLKPKLRLTVEGILFRLRTGCPWRDLPTAFGDWQSVYSRFKSWCSTGKLQQLFALMSKDTDTEWEFIDGSYIKAHQHSAGAATQDSEAIGISRAGRTTKIHLAVDSYGLPIQFIVTSGEVHDCKAAPDLLAMLPPSTAVVADKGYDSAEIRALIQEKGSIAVIPRKSNSLQGNADMDWALYKYRHLVENAFARLKHFRAIATRYDKLKSHFEGLLSLACCMMWIQMI